MRTELHPTPSRARPHNRTINNTLPQNLFKLKLELCTVMYDFDDQAANKRYSGVHKRTPSPHPHPHPRACPIYAHAALENVFATRVQKPVCRATSPHFRSKIERSGRPRVGVVSRARNHKRQILLELVKFTNNQPNQKIFSEAVMPAIVDMLVRGLAWRACCLLPAACCPLPAARCRVQRARVGVWQFQPTRLRV